MYFQVIINSFGGFGPYCICFTDSEPCTVYNLKERLAKTTTFSIEQQRIRSLGGRILTDSDDLLEDYSITDGPIILNLTIGLIRGRVYKPFDTHTMETEQQQQLKMTNVDSAPFMKKIRVGNQVINTVPQYVSQSNEQEKESKGKGKNSKKRKRV